MTNSVRREAPRSAAVDRRAVTAAPTARDRRQLRGRGRGGSWPEWAGGLGALAVYSWRSGDAGIWRDEASTLSAARRDVGQIVQLAGTEDLVHTLYYLLVHIALSVHDSVAAARAPSVLAMAATVAVLVRLGRRLGSLAIGVVAAGLLVASPAASAHAQNARSEALVALVAVSTTLMLLSAARDGTRVAWLRYGAAIVVLGALNLMGLLLLGVHAVMLVTAGLPLGAERADRRRALRQWAVAVTGAGLLLAPFALAAWAQRDQISWMESPQGYHLTAFYVHAVGGKVPLVLIALACLAASVAASLAASVAAVRQRGRRGVAERALWFGLTWAVLPPSVLWTVSQLHPMWDEHYVFYCLPGLMLAVAAAAFVPAVPRRLRVGGAAGLVALVAVAGLPAQLAARDPVSGHGEDLDGATHLIADQRRPGDGILFGRRHLRTIVAAFPGRLVGLDDVALAVDPVTAGSLGGVEVAPEQVPAALARTDRIWVVQSIRADAGRPGAIDQVQAAALEAAGFRIQRATPFDGIEVLLYSR